MQKWLNEFVRAKISYIFIIIIIIIILIDFVIFVFICSSELSVSPLLCLQIFSIFSRRFVRTKTHEMTRIKYTGLRDSLCSFLQINYKKEQVSVRRTKNSSEAPCGATINLRDRRELLLRTKFWRFWQMKNADYYSEILRKML